MSKLEELIQKLCPRGVVFKKIEEVSKTLTPKSKVKSHDYIEFGKYPVIDQGQNYIGGYTNEEGAFPTGEYIVFGDHTCIVKFINFAFIQGADGVKVIVPNGQILCKYLFYCMSNIKMDASYARHWSRMRAHSIPVPPLEVQREIVRILDHFTELTTELEEMLTAELNARREQYSYYLDRLLCENKDANIVCLGDVCNFFNGDRGKNYPTRNDYVDWGIPFINAGDIVGGVVNIQSCKKITKEKYANMGGAKLQDGDILYCLRGSIGKNGVFLGGCGTLASSLVAIRPNNTVSRKYVYYLLNSNLELKQRIAKDNGAAQPNLSADSVKKYIFPFPTLAEQERIVSILDHFNALCNNLTSNLPAEIEARRKQYEYYRDKLLSFPALQG